MFFYGIVFEHESQKCNQDPRNFFSIAFLWKILTTNLERFARVIEKLSILDV